jgi:hypothetical protein
VDNILASSLVRDVIGNWFWTKFVLDHGRSISRQYSSSFDTIAGPHGQSHNGSNDSQHCRSIEKYHTILLLEDEVDDGPFTTLAFMAF